MRLAITWTLEPIEDTQEIKILGQFYFEHRQKTLNKILENRIQLRVCVCVCVCIKAKNGISEIREQFSTKKSVNIMHHNNRLNEESICSI